MGDWNITIRGTGSHHNPDYPADANRMAGRFVEQLIGAGHTVRAASFTHGGEDALVGGKVPAWLDPSGAGAPTVETDSARIMEDAGRRAFEAFASSVERVTGSSSGTWDSLAPSVRDAWTAAAKAVLR